MTYLYHLSDANGFEFDLTPPSLEKEGFIHLSAAHQVLRTANHWFAEALEVKILVLNVEHLKDGVKWEDSYGKGEEFPHYYGPLPEAAIEATARLKRNSEGLFEWPMTLAGLLSPLLERISDEPGVIEPGVRFPQKKLPERCLLCFFPEVLETIAQQDDVACHKGLGSEIGAQRVLTMSFKGREVAVCHPGVGGPLAAVTLEELVALGCRKFVVCGGAGSLVPSQTMGHLVVVNGAWRDEGLSHHYLPPAAQIPVDSTVVARICGKLSALGVSHAEGATWTTDALYRETPGRIARRREAGCLTVEMEIASLLAVAQYRGAELGAMVYCGDDLASAEWDFRDWTSAHSVRERLFWLGLETLV
jgi:uridine phosphorylase/uncharacterized protein (DUF952 family)